MNEKKSGGKRKVKPAAIRCTVKRAPGPASTTDSFSAAQFSDDYFRAQCRKALKGDSEAAIDLLYHVEEGLCSGSLSKGGILYLRIVVRRILDGIDPAKALGLARPAHRRKGTQQIDHLQLAATVELRVRQGMSVTKAKDQVSKDNRLSVRTIENAMKEYRAGIERLMDNQLADILAPPSVEELIVKERCPLQ